MFPIRRLLIVFTLFVLLTHVPSAISAQTFSRFDSIDIPEAFQNASAVILEKSSKYSYDAKRISGDYFYNFTETINVSYTVYIQSKEALPDFSTLYFPIGRITDNQYTIDVKTRCVHWKKGELGSPIFGDGIVEQDVVPMFFESPVLQGKSFTMSKGAISNLEVGDAIVIEYQYNIRHDIEQTLFYSFPMHVFWVPEEYPILDLKLELVSNEYGQFRTLSKGANFLWRNEQLEVLMQTKEKIETSNEQPVSLFSNEQIIPTPNDDELFQFKLWENEPKESLDFFDSLRIAIDTLRGTPSTSVSKVSAIGTSSVDADAVLATINNLSDGNDSTAAFFAKGSITQSCSGWEKLNNTTVRWHNVPPLEINRYDLPLRAIESFKFQYYVYGKDVEQHICQNPFGKMYFCVLNVIENFSTRLEQELRNYLGFVTKDIPSEYQRLHRKIVFRSAKEFKKRNLTDVEKIWICQELIKEVYFNEYAQETQIPTFLYLTLMRHMAEEFHWKGFSIIAYASPKLGTMRDIYFLEELNYLVKCTDDEESVFLVAPSRYDRIEDARSELVYGSFLVCPISTGPLKTSNYQSLDKKEGLDWEQNVSEEHTSLKLNVETGVVELSKSTTYSGLMAYNRLLSLQPQLTLLTSNRPPKKEKKKAVWLAQLDLSNSVWSKYQEVIYQSWWEQHFVVKEYQSLIFKRELGVSQQTIVVEEQVVLDGLTQFAGPHLIVHISRLIGPQIQLGQEEKVRTKSAFVGKPHQVKNEYELEIPAGYEVVNAQDFFMDVDCEAASFKSSARVEGNLFILEVSQGYKKAVFTPEEWEKAVATLDAAYKFTQQKLILKKVG